MVLGEDGAKLVSVELDCKALFSRTTTPGRHSPLQAQYLVKDSEMEVNPGLRSLEW